MLTTNVDLHLFLDERGIPPEYVFGQLINGQLQFGRFVYSAGFP